MINQKFLLLPVGHRLFGSSGKSHKARESCPDNNISPGGLTGKPCSLSVKWADFPAPMPAVEAWHGWFALGFAWQSHNVGLTGSTCQHSRGLVDRSIYGCTDPLTRVVDLSCCYLPTVCSLLCHPFLSANLFFQ